MIRTRVIPCLLLEDGALVKTERFGKRRYIGDPLNAVRIFNELEVDELAFLDITATNEGREPPFQLLSEIASECFMPLMYGGGIKNIDQIQRILGLGFEKIALNTSAIENPRLISEAAAKFGSQSVVVSIDAKETFWGRSAVTSRSGRKKHSLTPEAWAREVARLGAGEILLNSVDRDGRMEGYDLDLIQRVASAVEIPVIAVGGAGNLSHLKSAITQGGASAVAVGSMVVFQSTNRAVLLNFPTPQELQEFVP